MERDKILKEVQLAIQEELNSESCSRTNSPLPSSNNTLLQLGMDSLNILNVVLKLEEKFNIHIDDEEWSKIAEQSATSTVSDFVDIVISKL